MDSLNASTIAPEYHFWQSYAECFVFLLASYVSEKAYEPSDNTSTITVMHDALVLELTRMKLVLSTN